MNAILGEAEMTKKQLLADVEYLAQRAKRTGSYVASATRDWGVSSNSLVGLAYGTHEDAAMPADISDLDACVRAYEGLPEHRKTKVVLGALKRQEKVVKR